MHRYLSSISPRSHKNMFFQRRKEQKFIGRLCAGQSGAWGQLIDRWSPHLYSYIMYNVGDDAETRRLMHLILSEVIHTIIDTPRIKSLTILIFSIAYRHLLHYRWQHPSPNLANHRSGQQPAQGTATAWNNPNANFVQRFHQFSPETQQLLLLRYVCHIKLTELSQIVGQSEEMLAQTLYRAKLYLL